MAGPTTHGFQWDDANDELKVYVNGVQAGIFSEGATGGDGWAVTDAGALEVATLDVSGNATFQSTITAGSDGVGSAGEQLTSGGAGQPTNWAAAGSLRQFKKVLGIREDTDEALRLVVDTPVYDFQYKDPSEAAPGERLTTTGDTTTVYTGIMADEAPWAMHHNGRILNPINALGYAMLAIKALNAKIERLEAQANA